MDIIRYLLTDTAAGAIAIILVILGIILLSFSEFTLHNNNSFSKQDKRDSRKIFGAILILAGVIVIIIALILSQRPITAQHYQTVEAQSQEAPEINAYIKAQLLKRDHLSRYNYFVIQEMYNHTKHAQFRQNILESANP